MIGFTTGQLGIAGIGYRSINLPTISFDTIFIRVPIGRLDYEKQHIKCYFRNYKPLKVSPL